MPTENRSASDQQYTLYNSQTDNITRLGLIKQDEQDHSLNYPMGPIESNISNANESGKIVLVSNSAASVVVSESPKNKLNKVAGTVLKILDNYVFTKITLIQLIPEKRR